MGVFERLTGKITRSHLREFLAPYATDAYTLDIGCANSPYSRLFPKRVGLDVAPGAGVDVVADAHALPFEDATFDQILCTEVLEHLHTPSQAITEMRRVLKPGGRIILTTRFVFPLHDVPHDYFRYTKYGLKHLFKDWEVERLVEETNTLETIAVLLQRVGYQTTLRCNKVSKVLIFLLARLVAASSKLIVTEYGDIKKSVSEKNIMTSGYYLVARK